MTDNKETERDDHTGMETTGHDWDGIKELDTPMPRWWLWTMYATFVWGLAYVIAYPAWPMVTEATAGVLGYSSRGEVAEEIARFEDMNAPLDAAIVQAELTGIESDAALRNYAVNGGAAIFRTYCSQCHGAGAAGAPGGYPNLLDDDWLWGGDVEAIYLTVAHGIRHDPDPDTRYSEMPAFGDILEDEEIDAVVAYVAGLSSGALGDDHPGAEVYLDNCADCHGEEGEGMRDLGAPNLADAIWLYGGDEAAIEQTVRYSRYGQMPAWNTRLTEAELRQVAVYVHGLGGGE
ncbi:MAG: cytochrome-c oxidase, cbb3-type subunit III [Pseudomonadota bacterium]